MLIAEILFWIFVSLVFYVYGGYYLLLKFLTLFKRKSEKKASEEIDLKSISIVITVHNEEKLIERRIQNCLALDYPQDRLQIVVASDGSTDRTNAIVQELAKKYPNIKLHPVMPQRGRAFTLNSVIDIIQTDLVLFTDANTIFNKDYLMQIMPEFNDPRVGCVSGQLTYENFKNNTITENESFYWKLETKMRELETQLGICTSISGCNFTIKKQLYTPILLAYEIDDIYPYRTVKAGLKVRYKKQARVIEDSPETLSHQLYARERIVIQGWPGIFSEVKNVYFLKNPGYLFSVISHRFLRWLSPFFLIGAFVANLFLLQTLVYQFLLAMQIIFMSIGLVGWFCSKYQKKVKIIGSLFAFYIANIGFFFGITKLIGNVRMQKY